jgi:hypothetical protein
MIRQFFKDGNVRDTHVDNVIVLLGLEISESQPNFCTGSNANVPAAVHQIRVISRIIRTVDTAGRSIQILPALGCVNLELKSFMVEIYTHCDV